MSKTTVPVQGHLNMLRIGTLSEKSDSSASVSGSSIVLHNDEFKEELEDEENEEEDSDLTPSERSFKNKIQVQTKTRKP